MLPVLPSSCSVEELYRLSWTVHLLTPGDAPARRLSPPGSSNNEPDTSCRWDCCQRYRSTRDGVWPPYPYELTPRRHPATPFLRGPSATEHENINYSCLQTDSMSFDSGSELMPPARVF